MRFSPEAERLELFRPPQTHDVASDQPGVVWWSPCLLHGSILDLLGPPGLPAQRVDENLGFRRPTRCESRKHGQVLVCLRYTQQVCQDLHGHEIGPRKVTFIAPGILASEPIALRKGLPQGCSTSPAVFAIAVEFFLGALVDGWKLLHRMGLWYSFCVPLGCCRRPLHRCRERDGCSRHVPRAQRCLERRGGYATGQVWLVSGEPLPVGCTGRGGRRRSRSQSAVWAQSSKAARNRLGWRSGTMSEKLELHGVPCEFRSASRVPLP